jgi:hypothetical protein
MGKSNYDKYLAENFDKETAAVTKQVVGFMNRAYRNGCTLKDIYDNACDVYGKAYGHAQAVFNQFIMTNKENEKFMSEFNETSFIDHIIFSNPMTTNNSEKMKQQGIICQQVAIHSDECGQTKLF